MVDVGEPVGVGEEEDALAGGVVDGVGVLGAGEGRHRGHRERLDVEEGEHVVAEGELVEVGLGAPVRHERQRAPVRRPRRMQVGVLVAGELAHVAGLQLVDVQVGDPAGEPGEGDLAPVGRPRRVLERPQPLDLDPLQTTALDVHDRQLVIPAGHHHEGESAAVRSPGTAGVHVADAVDVRRLVPLQGSQHPPGLHIGEVEVHREEVPLGPVDDVAPVRTEGRGDVHAPSTALLAQQHVPGLVGVGPASHHRPVLGLHGVPPLRGDAVLRQPEHLVDGVLPTDLQAGAVELRDRLVPVDPAEIGDEPLAEAVGEVLAVAGHLHQVRLLVPVEVVPEPHGGVGVLAPERQVLRGALEQPEGQRRQPHHPGAGLTLRDVVLEGVHQFVAEHRVRLPVGGGQRHDHPILERLGDPAGALADRAL